MPIKKKKAAPKARKSAKAGADSIRIRMYRVGFGDCFLVTFGGDRHVLVDCGVHNAGNIKVGAESLLQKAFDNIREETGGKLALVVATHAHQDHVSGFGTFADDFRAFEIGDVWMPWTEDPDDATARSWRTKKAALLGLLQPRLAGAANAAAAAAADNAGANPEAMAALHSGFGKVKPRYLKAGDELTAIGGIAGLSAQILGPPRDQKFISKMDPPGSDHYLRMAALAGQPGGVQPFATWGIPSSEIGRDWPRLDGALIAQLSTRAEFPAAAAAFALDKMLNNTSIVALFSYAGRRLLFPGDAQYGDWSYWYKEKGQQLLSDVSFYKVSHHGSMNATPKGALEEMPVGKFAAMASTQNTPWPSIPQPALMDAIAKQTAGAFMRSDSLAAKGGPEGPVVRDMPRGFTRSLQAKDEYWVDYCIG